MNDDERFSQDAIDRLSPVEPSAHLQRMVAQIPISHPREEASWWPFKSVWMPSFSLAAAALLGLFVGQSWEDLREQHAPVAAQTTDDSQAQLDPAEQLAATALDNNVNTEPSDELDDLLVLATSGDFHAVDWDLTQSAELNEESEETY